MERVVFSLITASIIWLGFSANQTLSISSNKQPNTVLAQKTVNFDYHKSSTDLDKLFNEINLARQKKGLGALQANQELTDVAQKRAEDMQSKTYYAHQSPDGLYYHDLMKTAGLQVQYSCENLNLDFTYDTSSHINSWLNSKNGHRECMLNSHITQAGYAVAVIPADKFNGFDKPSVIVVAIYSTPTEKTIALKQHL